MLGQLERQRQGNRWRDELLRNLGSWHRLSTEAGGHSSLQRGRLNAPRLCRGTLSWEGITLTDRDPWLSDPGQPYP